MSQQKKIIYISEENYNILWNNGAKDGSFTKNGVTYYYDEDATYYVPAPNGGAEIPSDPIFNSIVVAPSVDSTGSASAGTAGSFIVDETGFIVDYSNINFSVPDIPNAAFTLGCGSWPIITASTSDTGAMGDVSMYTSNFIFNDNGITNPASVSFWNGANISGSTLTINNNNLVINSSLNYTVPDEGNFRIDIGDAMSGMLIYNGNTKVVQIMRNQVSIHGGTVFAGSANFTSTATIANKAIATQEYVDNALGDIETLLASI